MRIDRIVLKNFKSIRDYDTGDLPDGIIGITGGNGQGKSTLLTAVAYALYGPDALSTGRADAVTWGEGKLEVTLFFDIDGHYSVHRTQDSKGNSTAELWDLESRNAIAQGPKDVNRAIQYLVGIDLVGFQASVFSKQDDLLGLGSLTTAKRVSTMLRLLGIDQIDKAIKHVNEKGKEYRNELEVLRRAHDYDAQIDVHRYQKELKDLNTQKSKLEIDLVRLHGEFELAQQNRDSLQKDFERWTEYKHKVDRVRAQLVTAMENHGRLMQEVQSRPVKPDLPTRIIDLEEYAYRNRDYVARSTSLKKSQAEGFCPTCKRPFDNVDEKYLAQEQKEVDNLLASIENDAPAAFATEAYARAERDYQAAVDRFRDSERSVAGAQKAADALADKLRSTEAEWTGEDPSTKYREATAALTTVGNEFAKAGHDLDVLNATIAGHEKILSNAKEREDKSKSNLKLMKLLEKEVVDYATCSSELAAFKTSMVSGVIPTLSERASELITVITEGKYSELILTPQYDIQYRNDQGDPKAFPNLSGGEQDAFALAMRLAIADLRASSIGILVLDEVFESLDPDRQESTWLALDGLSSRFNQVFLVTHVANFKDRAPYTIDVSSREV